MPRDCTDGDVLLLENIRFDKRETSKDDGERRALARQLAELVSPGGAFVSDGFGVVHRKQASVYDVAELLPHYAGTLVADEIRVLEQLTSSTERPYAVVLGGSKVSDKLGGDRVAGNQGRQHRHRRRHVLHIPCRTGIFGGQITARRRHDRDRAATCWTPTPTCCDCPATSW